MPAISLRLTRSILLLTCGLLLLPMSATAAKGNEPKWYQVEIILFAHEPYGVTSTEHWRDHFNPLYPEDTVILRPFNTQSALGSIQAVAPPVGPSTQQITGGINTVVTPIEADAPIDMPINLEKDPFIILPSKDWQLNEEVQRLKRSSDFRVLEHVAWRQPANSRERSQPILVQAGSQYGLYFEVEGLITVSENRYLHVDTDLFFSKYTLDPYQNFIDWSSLRESPLMSANKADTPPALSHQSIEPRKKTESISFQGPQQQYRREYATPLKHIRRIRAGELHYVDHPLFGLLVKLTPYQLPDEAMDIIELDTSILPVRKPLPGAL